MHPLRFHKLASALEEKPDQSCNLKPEKDDTENGAKSSKRTDKLEVCHLRENVNVDFDQRHVKKDDQKVVRKNIVELHEEIL